LDNGKGKIMNIESVDLKKSLVRMLDGTDDVVGRSFDRGIQTAIKLIEIYEEIYGTKIAEALDGHKS
jgi:hypothetical protein